MKIVLKDLSKRFDENYVLRNINFTFENNCVYGLKGANGSGKSTLLKMLCGFLTHSSGSIDYRIGQNQISRNDIYRYVSFTAPYIELIEQLNLEELFEFHQAFRPMAVSGFKEFESILDYSVIKSSMLIGNYSSGMKNRVKLALHILTNAELLLLDEPSSFLDEEGIEWFQLLLKNNLSDKTIIIASNDEVDFKHCQEIIDIKEIQTLVKTIS